MKISWKTLLRLVDTQNLPVGGTLYSLHRHYCNPMTARGLCTENCLDCQKGLGEAFDLGEARNPSSLLIWRLRNLLASKQEVPHEAPKMVDAFGLPTSETPFEDLRREYAQQTPQRRA